MSATQGQPGSEHPEEPHETAPREAEADSVADTGLEGGVDEPNEALDAELDDGEEGLAG